MTWDQGLTGPARAIAATDESPVRVMAGPGTGKSFALKRRVARLLEGGQQPQRILAVTFTRNAAASLVDDLHDLGIPNCEDIRAGTLHSFCFRLLSQQEVFEFLERVPRPLVTFSNRGCFQFEGKAMLHDIASEGNFGALRSCSARVRAFEAAWARRQSEDPGWPSKPIDRQFESVLLGWLRFHRAMLIGEVIPETLRYLRNNPACPARKSFDHVLVDEYQDLNRAEQELVELLAGNGSLGIVGDADQSIYRFRHANPEGIDDFGTRHQAIWDSTLDECRRCPTRVVAIADHLIRQNHSSVTAPRLRPFPNNPAGEVHITQWNDVEEEGEGLAQFLAHLVESGRYLPGEILVLTPRRLLGYAIRDHLVDLDVPTHSFSGEEVLESDAAQRTFALMSLLVDRDDRVALRWWLGEGSQDSRRGAYHRLREYCEGSGASPTEVLEELDQERLAISYTTKLVEKYRELKDALGNLTGLSVTEVVEQLMPTSNEDLRRLREAATLAAAGEEELARMHSQLKGYVSQPEIPTESDYIRVMSLHKSKGLSSKVVVVAGCIEGLVPFRIEDGNREEVVANLEEQRRLFYVAITRCREVLVLSSCLRMERRLAHQIRAKLRGGGGVIGDTLASRFLSELGPLAPAARVGAEWISEVRRL